MQTRHACVGALLVDAGQILLGQRSPNRAFYPDVWDVFGGHIEANETPEDTLIRELKEEIGIEPTQWSYLETVSEITGGDLIECRIYVVTDWQGVPTNLQPEEHAMIRWFSLESAVCLKLTHPSYPSIFARAINE